MFTWNLFRWNMFRSQCERSIRYSLCLNPSCNCKIKGVLLKSSRCKPSKHPTRAVFVPHRGHIFPSSIQLFLPISTKKNTSHFFSSGLLAPGTCVLARAYAYSCFKKGCRKKKTNVKMHAAIQQGIVGSHTRYILYPISYGPPSKIVTVRPGRGIAGLLYTFDLLKSIDHIPD